MIRKGSLAPRTGGWTPAHMQRGKRTLLGFLLHSPHQDLSLAPNTSTLLTEGSILHLIMAELGSETKLQTARFDELSDEFASRILITEVTRMNDAANCLLLWSVKTGPPCAGKTTASILCTRKMISEDVPLTKGSLIVDSEQPFEACKALEKCLRKVYFDQSHQRELEQWYSSLGRGESQHIDLTKPRASRSSMQQAEIDAQTAEHPQPPTGCDSVIGCITYWTKRISEVRMPTCG